MRFRTYNLECGRLDILTIWLCLFLNFFIELWDKVSYRLRKKLISVNNPKILVIKPDRLGDVLVSFPVLKALRKTFPDSNISILIGSWSIELLKLNRDINNTIVFDLPYYIKTVKIPRTVYQAFLFSIRLMRLSLLLKKERFDIVLDLNNTWATKLISYLTEAPKRIGSAKHGKGFMMTDELLIDISQHQVEQNLVLATSLGVKVTNSNIVISTPRDTVKVIKDFLVAKGIKDSQLVVGVHSGAGYPSKLWFPERFASVIDSFITRFGATVVLIGTETERSITSNIIGMVDNKESVINTCGRFSIPELCCLIRRFNLLITLDSFPMHVASAVETPVIAIFSGVNDPKRWGPYGNDHVVICKNKSVPCSPCLQGICLKGNNICMDLISSEEVIEAAAGKLIQLGWSEIIAKSS